MLFSNVFQAVLTIELVSSPVLMHIYYAHPLALSTMGMYEYDLVALANESG